MLIQHRPRDHERDAIREAELPSWEPRYWTALDDIFYERTSLVDLIRIYDNETPHGRAMIRGSLVARLRALEAKTGAPSGWETVAADDPEWTPPPWRVSKGGWPAFESAVRALVPPTTASELVSDSDAPSSGGGSGPDRDTP